jgi:hypothetical protein
VLASTNNFEALANTRDLTVTATDGTNNTTITVTMGETNVNEAPVGVDDTTTTPEDTPVTVDVLANDSDVDGPALSIKSATVPVAQGTVAIVGGKLVFTPAPNFNGIATISYVATDGTLDTAVTTATITVTPVADNLTVSSPVVNEASPYAVFTVDGVAGESVNLALAGVGATGAGTDFGASDATTLQVSLDNGATWSNYSAAVTLPVGGAILVRTPILEDGISDNNETFTLTATPAGGTAAVGTGTIKDDGTGSIYKPDGTVDPSAAPSDDRPLTVNSTTVSESSPYVVFAVTGLPNQLVRLVLESGTATVGTDTGTALEYFDGSVWQAYVPGALVAIPGTGTTLLVRTAIRNDAAFEGAESFQLKVRNSGGAAFAGTATIKDDGSSANVFEASNATPTPTLGEANDDQSKPVTVVPEAAAPAQAATPTPVAPLPPGPARPVAEPFDSAIVVITPSRLQTTERPAALGEILTSVAGFRVVVAAAETPSLTVFRGITDQFVEGNKPTVFSLPADAFVHTKADAVVIIMAKLANGDDLPAWVQFDARAGTFKLDPPTGFNDELQIKVIARDNEGREAVSLFKFHVGEGKVKAKVSGRSSLSEQIAGAGRRSMPWLDQVRARDSQAVRQVRG